MLRTALLCALLAGSAWACADRLTHGGQAWTAEGARRLEVALAPVPTPAARVEGDGLAFDLHELLANGRDVTIVDFFYTHCETVCLSLGSSFQQIQRALLADAPGGRGRVKLLSISFDPQRDTPADLRAYAQRLRAEPGTWRFVRVPQAPQLQQLLGAFQVTVVPDGRGDFQHNAALLVVSPDGRLLRVFDLSEQQLALDYARHLAAGGTP